MPRPVSSPLSWPWPGDATLLQVDVFCGAGVLHKLLVELLERSPRRQADTQESPGRGRISTRGFHPERWGPYSGLCFPPPPRSELLSSVLDTWCFLIKTATEERESQDRRTTQPSLCELRMLCRGAGRTGGLLPSLRLCWGPQARAGSSAGRTHSPHRFCQRFGGFLRHKDVAGKPVVSRVLGNEPKVPAEGQQSVWVG